MRWDDILGQQCSIARALAEIGDRWTLLLVRDAFMRARRFEDFVQRSGASRNLVADRLEKLVEAGILEPRQYQERPDRYEYRLTEKGVDLYPVIMTLVHWGDRWHDDGGGPPVVHVHRGCGRQTHAETVCAECGDPLDPREMEVALRDPDIPYWQPIEVKS